MTPFVKSALRVLRKDLSYSLINLVGLSFGLAFGFLMFIYVSVETSYDKHYPQADEIYRVGISYDIGGNIDDFCNLARPAGPALKAEFPEVIEQTRVAGYNGLYEHKAFFETDQLQRISSEHVFTADSTFFKVFDRSFISGSAPNPLASPKSVVLSERLAAKIFGDRSPILQQIKLDGKIPVTVTGVFRDIPNAKTHLPYEAILSWDLGARPGEENVWIGWHVYTYALVQAGFEPSVLIDKFSNFKKKYMQKTLDQYEAKANLILQPLSSIHLHSDLTWEAYANGNENDVMIFSIVALFLILITSINYVNLTTARSSNRAKEIGIKKVMGCRIWSLRSQFLIESVLLVLIAAVFGWVISAILLPSFNNITDQNIDLTYLYRPGTLGIYLGVALCIGLLSGLYPAYYMSGISEFAILKGRFSSSNRGVLLRKGLITFQFAVSIAVIAGTVLVIRQLDYIGSKDLGFDKENVMVIDIKNSPSESKLEGMLLSLTSHPGIRSATSTQNIPGFELNQTLFDIPDTEGNYNAIGGQFVEVNRDFVEVLGMKITDGRNFLEASAKDRSGSLMLNEAAAEAYGWKGNAIGKKIGVGKDSLGNRNLYEVIGVVEDFHVGSLHNQVQPIVIFHQEEVDGYVLVKLEEERVSEAVAFISSEWESFDSEAPMDYSFLDQNFQSFYDRENKLFAILTYLSMLIISINALGLLGLLSYSVKQKRREIGIRRVLGSDFMQQQRLLIKDYVWTLVVGVVVGCSTSWYVLDGWLQNFHYRIDWQGWEFFVAIFAILLVTFSVFAWILKRTLRENPAHVLRHE
ncbi:MAG: FtsX-like permease family protein [Reichenbachiella sp.]|uniref:FtsX-like permease family protein n=1 Tax=Reichenbachiella sp. TaxID=2184521 RepID=UPI00326617F8